VTLKKSSTSFATVLNPQQKTMMEGKKEV
jgi:hypothetical protein